MFRWLVQGLCGVALSCQVLAASADPPQYVGRVALAEGEVVLVPAAGEDEIAAPTNYPLAAGARLQTRGRSGAEIEFAGVRVWLAGDSELVVLQTEAAAEEAAAADAQPALQLALGAGALVVRVDDPAPRIAPRIETAGALIELRKPGDYRLDSTGTTAAVVVRRGLLRVDAGGSLAYLTDGQRVELADGTLGATEDAGAPVAEDFDAWVAARQAPPAPRYVSSEMPGAGELATYGSWEHTADYGPVWAPYWVPTGWAPYRNGEWVWLPPWGWTWIDHAPWGFAPFHFGRWAHHHGRWCWVPGAGRPIFAPGLVQVFDGGTHGGHKHPRHGKPQRWAPLTPHDKFVPTFPASGRFTERVNAGHGRWLGRGRTAPPSESSSAATPVASIAGAMTTGGAEMKVSQWPGGRAWRDRGGGRPVPRHAGLPIRPATPPTPAAASAGAAPAVGAAPVFAPALGPGRAAGERLGRRWQRDPDSTSAGQAGLHGGREAGRRWDGESGLDGGGRAGAAVGPATGPNAGPPVGRRGDFVAPAVVAAPAVPSVPPVVAVPLPAATPVLPARGEADRRSNWRERSSGAWPQAPASVTTRPATATVPQPAVAAPAPQRSGRSFGPSVAPAVTVNPPAATSSAVPTLRRFGGGAGGDGGRDSGRGGGRSGGRGF